MFQSLFQLPQVVAWLRYGCHGFAPPIIKRRIIASYLKRFQIETFVETGTYLGDTLAFVARNRGINCVSIELGERLFDAAKKRFRHHDNVKLLCGDSGALMAAVVKSAQSPVLYWLDGHYSEGITARGEQETPIMMELEAILSAPSHPSVILIDDARCFIGQNGYPKLIELLNFVDDHENYAAEVSVDIVRLIHKSLLFLSRGQTDS